MRPVGEESEETGRLPSILLLFAEEQIAASLRNSIKFVIQFLESKYSATFSALRLCSRGDELSLAIECAIQYCYLARWNASWSERFLGLQRFGLIAPNSGVGTERLQPLSAAGRHIAISLAAICIVPYLVDRLDAIHKRASAKLASADSDYNNHLSRVEIAILEHYPRLLQFCEIAKILLTISYATGGADYGHNLCFAFLRTISSVRMILGHANHDLLLDQRSGLLHAITGKVASALDYALKISAFGVQFLEIWYARADVRHALTAAAANRGKWISGSSSPPSPPRSQSTFVGSKNHRLCPLCLRERINPTAVPISGYVFCYACIHRYVKLNARCPVTKFPCSLDQLIRVFDH